MEYLRLKIFPCASILNFMTSYGYRYGQKVAALSCGQPFDSIKHGCKANYSLILAKLQARASPLKRVNHAVGFLHQCYTNLFTVNARVFPFCTDPT